MATSLGLDLQINKNRKPIDGLLAFPFTRAAFSLFTTNSWWRFGRDIVLGYWTGQTPQPLFLTADGDRGFPPDWFEDGTISVVERGLRLLIYQEAGYAAARFGRTPHDSQRREISDVSLQDHVERYLNIRPQIGNQLTDIARIGAGQDPYYWYSGVLLGEFVRRCFDENATPRGAHFAYGEEVPGNDLSTSFSWDRTMSIPQRNFFDIMFPTKIYDVNYEVGEWHFRASGSTPSGATGPNPDNNDRFVFVEASGTSNNFSQREQESARAAFPTFLNGQDRTLTMEVCLQGAAFQNATTNLSIQFFDEDANPERLRSATPLVEHIIRGWAYSTTNRNAGDAVVDYGGESFTVSRDGGWRTVTFSHSDGTLPNTARYMAIRPKFTATTGLRPIHTSDMAIRRIALSGTV